MGSINVAALFLSLLGGAISGVIVAFLNNSMQSGRDDLKAKLEKGEIVTKMIDRLSKSVAVQAILLAVNSSKKESVLKYFTDYGSDSEHQKIVREYSAEIRLITRMYFPTAYESAMNLVKLDEDMTGILMTLVNYSHGVGIDKTNIDDLAIALMKINANTKIYAEEATSSIIEEINAVKVRGGTLIRLAGLKAILKTLLAKLARRFPFRRSCQRLTKIGKNRILVVYE